MDRTLRDAFAAAKTDTLSTHLKGHVGFIRVLVVVTNKELGCHGMTDSDCSGASV